MAEAPIDKTEQPHLSIVEFNKLAAQYQTTYGSPGHNALAQTIEQVITSQGDEQAQQDFLRESLRQRIITASAQTVEVLGSESVKRMYFAGQDRVAPEEFESMARSNLSAIYTLIHRTLALYKGISLDHPEQPYSFPYQKLNPADSLDMISISSNVGHDLVRLPGFSHIVYQLYESLDLQESLTRGQDRLALRFLPVLYQGLVWTFAGYRQMAEHHFPLTPNVNLSQVLRVATAEAAVRAFHPATKNHLLLGEEHPGNPRPEHQEKFYPEKFTVTANISDNLRLKGNESGLHLLFYQFLKNSVKLLQLPDHKIQYPEISVDASTCNLNGQELIAVRVQDNGPGLDIAGILRAKQRFLRTSKSQLSPQEQQVAGDWSSLDLRIIDIVNYIFERRISALDRVHLSHSGSGLGLAMAKEFIEQHGGCVWATNLAGDLGAKFLIILDGSEDGSLRREIPELYQTEKVPVELLNSIDHQLDVFK